MNFTIYSSCSYLQYCNYKTTNFFSIRSSDTRGFPGPEMAVLCLPTSDYINEMDCISWTQTVHAMWTCQHLQGSAPLPRAGLKVSAYHGTCAVYNTTYASWGKTVWLSLMSNLQKLIKWMVYFSFEFIFSSINAVFCSW